MIPGQNILNMAMGTIATTAVDLYRFNARDTNAAGIMVSDYLPAVEIRGSLQPVPRTNYQQLGLDLQKRYWNFYASHPLIDPDRDVSGDIINGTGRQFNAVSVTPWLAIDGWNALLMVDIGSASVPRIRPEPTP